VFIALLGASNDAMIVMNPGGPKSGSGTPFSVSEVIAMETDQLLRIANEGGFGKRKQQALKALVRSYIIIFIKVLNILYLGI
jgi:hypothetical protein